MTGKPDEGSERGEGAGTRVAVLQTLREAAAPLTIVDLAERVGVHPNTIRYHLARLVEHAQVEQVVAQHRGPGRPPQMFRVTPGMDPTGPRSYRALATALVHSVAAQPEPGARALEVGRAWGHELGSSVSESVPEESVEQLITILDDLGFAPERDDDEPVRRIGLRHCPFLELAVEQQAVVCPLHLGLMQGALQAWQAPVGVDQLEPFVAPDRCLTRLSATRG